MNASILETTAATPRLNYAKVAPATLQAMLTLQQAANRTGLEQALLELVKLRVSHINGCAFCIDMHYREAVKAGETPARLYLLDAWTETDLYTARERAALRWAEAMAATATGELQDLLAVLTDDAVLYTDGGGRVRSALRPIESADHIGRFFLGIRERGLAGAMVKRVRVNGDVGVLTRRADGVLSVTSFAFAGDRIRAIYTVSNPEKLRHVQF